MDAVALSEKKERERKRPTRPIWKITFASGVRITDNLFVTLVAHSLNYASTRLVLKIKKILKHCGKKERIYIKNI